MMQRRRQSRLEIFVWFAAWVGAPAMMLVFYQLVGALAWVRFRVVDYGADYLAGIIAALALLAVINLLPLPPAHRRALSLLWVMRVGVALGPMLLFEARYGIDSNGYYIMGKGLSDPASALEFGEGTRNIIAFVGLLSSVTGSYSAIKIIFAFAGLWAIYFFYRAAAMALGRDAIALLYLLGLVPSLLFWGSILGKDPVVHLGLGLFSLGAVGLVARNRIGMLWLVALGLFVASFIRPWLGVIFLTPLLIAYVLHSRASVPTKIAFLAAALPLFLFALQIFSDQFSVETTADLVRTTDRLSQAWAFGGSGQRLESGFDSLGAMIAFLPVGSFTALFRPLPLEVPNLFGTLAGLENAGVLLLLLAGLKRRGLGWLRQPALLWAALTVLVWSSAYGFVSYQNLGTAFRFRAQVLPILLMLALALASRERFGQPSTGTAPAGPIRPR